MTPMQYWKIEGELEIVQDIPESDKYVRNLQWHCPSCGRIWACAAFLERPQLLSKWEVVGERPCTKCNGGSILDIWTLTRLSSVPIPLEIFEREFSRELALYYSKWPHRVDPYLMNRELPWSWQQ